MVGKYLLITLLLFAVLILGGIFLFWKGVRFFRKWKQNADASGGEETL